MDFSRLLAEKNDEIFACWLAAVRKDGRIESAEELSTTAVRDGLPHVIAAMATVISRSERSQNELVSQKSFEHGTLRATQGFDAAEIAQEYHLLRKVIFSVLEPELLKSSTAEALRTVYLVDAVLDEAMSCCFKSYMEERLRELEQLHSQLSLNNQELARLVQVNRNNLLVLAHELKTPLNSIIGYSSLLLRAENSPGAVRDTFTQIEQIERVLRNGRQLLRLVNNALEFGRAQTGDIELHPGVTVPRLVVAQVIEVMLPLAAAKDIQITADCSEAPEQVVSDPMRLEQIVTNLVSNAVRYTPAGSIHLRCWSCSEKHWSLSVRDTGIGIAAEHQSQVFEPYTRFAAPAHMNPESTGLGLAIVEHLVKLLGGQVELSSELGVGSTFTVTFEHEFKRLSA